MSLSEELHFGVSNVEIRNFLTSLFILRNFLFAFSRNVVLNISFFIFNPCSLIFHNEKARAKRPKKKSCIIFAHFSLIIWLSSFSRHHIIALCEQST